MVVATLVSEILVDSSTGVSPPLVAASGVATVLSTLTGVLALLVVSLLVTLLGGNEFMQNEGTNSAALTFRVENFPSINVLSAVVSALSACCSHESGATLFAIFINLSAHPLSNLR